MPTDELLQEDYRKYLDPKVLAKIAALDLRARLIVEGYIQGIHKSPYQGFAVEFAQHRQYSPGDDLKFLDWKVFGRTDRYYIKQYEEETNLNCLFVVDCSESMAYNSGDGLSKYDYGLSLAAAIMYLALQQQDSVGLALFDTDVKKYIRPSNNPTQWKLLIHEMHDQTGPAKTSLGAVLHDLAERLSRRSLVVLVSDLFDDPRETIKGFQHLRYKRHEVIVFHVMDPYELTFPFEQTTLFKGLEFYPELLCEPRALRDGYLREVHRFTREIKRGCRDMHIDYELMETSRPLDVALSVYLATRAARLKR